MEAINPQAPPPSAQHNINTIVALEEASLSARTLADKVSDAIARFVGSISFVAIHVVWFGGWVGINAGLLRLILIPLLSSACWSHWRACCCPPSC